MSTRVSARNKRSRDAAKHDHEFIDDDSREKDPSNKRKIHRTKASRVEHPSTPWQRPRGRGKLKMLPEMPIDILLEIFGLLNPLDIIHLARTTKALRGILMSRSAIFVWRAAFTREPELPDMPNDMNEPQWANLVFSNHCHFCLSAGDYSILWSFRVRSCETCMKDRFASEAEVFRRLAGKMICKHSDLLFRARFRSKGTKTKKSQTKTVCSFADAKAVNFQLARLKNDKDHFDMFVAERRQLVVEVEKFVSKCEQSSFLRATRLLHEAEAAREERNQRIFQHLRDLGYGDEVERLNEVDPTILSEHSCIKQTKELTERAWSNMLPALVELMEDTRRKIQRKDRKSLLKGRLRLVSDVFREYQLSRSPTEILPSSADICSMPQVMAMLEDPAHDAFVTPDSFANLKEQFRQLCEEWVLSKNRELVSLMPKNPVDLIPGANEFHRLGLAMTFFKCSECVEPISYPRVLAHGCLTALRVGNRNREDDRALIYASLDCEPWNTGRGKISYFNAAEASARSVLESCGLDVDVVTAADLNDMDKWLECLRCTHRAKGRPVFKWQKAIVHDINHVVSDNQSAVWKLLNDDDAKLAQKQEDDKYLSHHCDSTDFVCVRCGERMSFLPGLKSHVRFSHGVQGFQKEDYRLDLDAAIQPPFSIMIPNPSDASDKRTVIDLVTLPSGAEPQYMDSDDDDLYV